MEELRIVGGRPLCGQVTINGAKNAVLPILAATVLHGGTYVLDHCPEITDVELAAEIITYLGGSVTRRGKTLVVCTEPVSSWEIPPGLMKEMRASILFLGPLLVRFGRAVLTMPGGCPLGRRPIDFHLSAMTRMGATVTMEGEKILCEAGRLRGCAIHLPMPSVGATENILLAAMGAEGTVTLHGAAREPEIGDLVQFLRSMGGEIRGEGSSTLQVTGTGTLHGVQHTILPDRIETATYLCAAAACGGDLTLHRTDQRLLLPVVRALREAGCRIRQEGEDLHLWSDGRLQAIRPVVTAPYPGFPTDCQALLMAALLRAEGRTRLTEAIFSGRLAHVPLLRQFGARVEVTGNTALLEGVPALHPASPTACDLRAAAALVIAALQIPGESRLGGLKHLHRGYDNLEGGLRSLGAQAELQETTGNFCAAVV